MTTQVSVTRQVSVPFLLQGEVYIQVFRFSSSKHYFVQSPEQPNTTEKQCKNSLSINIPTMTEEQGRKLHSS